jgi:hypothetical protein
MCRSWLATRKRLSQNGSTRSNSLSCCTDGRIRFLGEREVIVHECGVRREMKSAAIKSHSFILAELVHKYEP